MREKPTVQTLLLLFDVDATLIRTGGVGMRAMSRGFEEVMGWKDALNSISMAGMTDPAIAQWVSQRERGTAMPPEEMERVFARYLEVLGCELRDTDQFRVLPGIREFLEDYSKRPQVGLGLGTGNIEAGARIKLEHAHLFHYFQFGGFGSDAIDRAEMLRIAVQRGMQWAQIRPCDARVVVIGDTPKDIGAGKNIGAETLAVATGPYSTEQLQTHQPDLVVHDFNERQRIDEFLNTLIKEENAGGGFPA